MGKSKTPVLKHEAIRTCIATGVKKPKKQLIRLVRLPEDKVAVDLSGKLRGRGANIDMTLTAYDLAIKKGAIERALKLERELSQAEQAQLRVDFENAIAEKNFRVGNKPVVIRVSRDAL